MRPARSWAPLAVTALVATALLLRPIHADAPISGNYLPPSTSYGTPNLGGGGGGGYSGGGGGGYSGGGGGGGRPSSSYGAPSGGGGQSYASNGGYQY
ncbi:PREDICTED: pro-resilin [Trachymyrmex cornetzi]|uniref:pro-resilin n=1 Tax=Trachymyrmex cornetzi TaxID=471704 RepID=UPI00084F15CE|nr:PREDICTED: pro-resilin [Trachymyrmex cornetzi]